MDIFARSDAAQRSSRRITTLFVIILFTAVSPSVFAGPFSKKKEKSKVLSVDLSRSQPYPHHWFEAKKKKKASVFGQIYKARPDLAVLEMLPPEEKGAEIKAVRIRDKNGKVYAGTIRRLPASFMPTARRNYQQIAVSPGDVKGEVRL